MDHPRVLFVAVAPVCMRPTQFFGSSVTRAVRSTQARPSSSSTRQVPVALTPRKPKPPEKRKTRGRKRDLQQWQKFIDRDLNAERRGMGFWPAGSVERTARERRTRNVFSEKYNERILRDFKQSGGGVINTVLNGGPLDELVNILRARYLERVYTEQVDEMETPLDDDMRKLYAATIREIRRCDEAYYGDDPKPLVEDKVYDELVMHILELERLYPDIVIADSPSQVVGHSASRYNTALYDAMEEEHQSIRAQEMLQRQRTSTARTFRQLAHPVPMLSLGNAYSIVDLASFSKKVVHSKARICAELKIDGVALSLHYRERKLEAAVTRGNGRIGDNVIDNIRAGLIGRGVLESLPESAPDGLVIVRGEVFIPPAEFAALQQRLEVKLTNARNAAAGAIKHKDAAEVRERGVHFVAYDCLASQSRSAPEGDTPEIAAHWPTQGEALEGLKQWGFGYMPKYKVVDTIEQAESFAAEVESNRDALPFEADGVVLKVDEAEKRLALGNTAKAPRGAIALKFTARAVLTTLSLVKMQVSRTGVITPVAELQPVQVGGATIRRATLHNFDEIQRLGLAIGDEVVLERGGDVIPKIAKVHKRGERRVPIEIPKSCPCCDGDVLVEKNDAGNTTVKCTEPESCAGQNIGRLLHFVSRNAMDIRGVGTKTASKLLDSGLVVRLGDLFRLTIEDLTSLDGIKDRTATSLYEAIQEARTNRTLERLIISLGVPGIGSASARALAVRAINLQGLRDITTTGESMLLGTPNIAEKTAERIGQYLGSARMQAELKEIARSVTLAGVVDDPDDEDGEEKNVSIGNIQISGKRFAFTGKLHAVKRGEAVAKIKQAGGKVGDLTRKTDYLVCGVDPGEKYHKAQRFGVPIISEDEIAELLFEPKQEVVNEAGYDENGEATVSVADNVEVVPELPEVCSRESESESESEIDTEDPGNDELTRMIDFVDFDSQPENTPRAQRGPYWNSDEESDMFRMPLAQALFTDVTKLPDQQKYAKQAFTTADLEATQEGDRAAQAAIGLGSQELEDMREMQQVVANSPEDPVFKDFFENVLGADEWDDLDGTKGAFLPTEEELDGYLDEIFKDPENVKHAIELSQKYPVKKGKKARDGEEEDELG